MVLCDDPLPGVEGWVELVFDDPIARVTSLTPPSCRHFLSFLDFGTHRVYECLLAIWSQAIGLEDATVNVVVAVARGHLLGPDDGSSMVDNTLGDKTAWFSDKSDALFWEVLLDCCRN